MRRVLASFVVGFWLVSAGEPRAEEQVLDFQVVAHTTDVHSLPIFGRAGHEIGIAAFRGLAIFPGDRIASHWYSGNFDFVKGSGRIAGYALWQFEDGSRIEAAYSGETKAAADGGITFTAQYKDIVGTGRYAGFRGEGTFAGRRVDFLKQGGDTYFRGRLKLTSGAK
jgi:hypothetical protein